MSTIVIFTQFIASSAQYSIEKEKNSYILSDRIIFYLIYIPIPCSLQHVYLNHKKALQKRKQKQNREKNLYAYAVEHISSNWIVVIIYVIVCFW